VKIWLGFLMLSFLIGGRELKRGRATRFLVFFGLCVVAAVALRSQHFA
jgi:hypothetical protein